MAIPYFPGCTLKTKATGLDDSTRATLAALGLEVAELPEWTCCGTVYPLAQDNYMGKVAAARILINASKEDDGRLVTVCSFCYNVLKRVNHAIKNDEETRTKLTQFLEEEYAGETKLVHPLELLRDDVGFDSLQKKVNNKLKGIKVASYYGCMLSRPATEMQFDEEPENPTVMEDLVSAMGAEAVDFKYKTTCCGSYQVMKTYDLVVKKVREILEGAKAKGAQVIITSCPLCQFNLDWIQEKIAEEDSSFNKIPVLYFTQLLGVALDVPVEKLGLEKNYVDPKPLLQG
ncbi:MAG: disulfide reductase [Firmicutes bacterium]|nr:disulfide reductase [Bacillota bacterium]